MNAEAIRALILSRRTERGGWTRRQLAALGVAWPPPKGWIDEVARKGLTAQQVAEFVGIPVT